MAKSLLIGLGGTGSRVVNKVAKLLQENGIKINEDGVYCAVLDTDANDNGRIGKSKTGVPVIPTSRPGTIQSYFDRYWGIGEWCPSSDVFMRETIVDGASEVRVKSRLAFLDCMESGELEKQLGGVVNQILQGNQDPKIRVMIVCSVAGGTGSGMFLQAALWLRKRLPAGSAVIRGIFLLPDIFVQTTQTAHSAASQERIYANSYAAIRELNAITKVMKGFPVDLPEPIKIAEGGLFDSENCEKGLPVYDLAFFVDSHNQNRVRLGSIAAYEEMAANLAYMQIFAPMKDEMYSLEDNLFLSIRADKEPLYGACGTAKAEYPVRNVKEYCVLRAVQDSISMGWRSIDNEIDARVQERKQQERDGFYSNEELDVRQLFAELYENKVNVDPQEAGANRFFLSFAHDSQNEQLKNNEKGKKEIKYTNKVDDFLESLRAKKIDPVVDDINAREGGLNSYTVTEATKFKGKDDKETIEAARTRVEADQGSIWGELTRFEVDVLKVQARAIVDSVFPYNMDEVTVNNQNSIYALLTKSSSEGRPRFIHPLAARYVLYKLAQKLQQEAEDFAAVKNEMRRSALPGDFDETAFDNPRTKKKKEGTAQEFLNSRTGLQGLLQSEEKFVQEFRKKYQGYITGKINACKIYEQKLLQYTVYTELRQRVEALLKKYEAFFLRVKDVMRDLEGDIDRNLGEIKAASGSSYYVYASEACKESLYQSLDLQVGEHGGRINKIVADALYGGLCYERRPSTEANKKYAETSVSEAFYTTAQDVFADLMSTDSGCKDRIDLDIFTAVCREEDVRHPDSVKSGESKRGLTLQQYKTAFKDILKNLEYSAVPFLQWNKEKLSGPSDVGRENPKLFWGYHPVVREKYGEDLVGYLQVGADRAEDPRYPKNMLYCYQAVYGISATNIPKFVENEGGGYFPHYRNIVRRMVEMARGDEGDAAYIYTPHLDKHWHSILPYISSDKIREGDKDFYHGFWLAVAYGTIVLDKDKRFNRVEKIYSSGGKYSGDNKRLVLSVGQKQPVTFTNVAALLEALKNDQDFLFSLPDLEKEYREELDGMGRQYVSTKVYNGLKQDGELNAVTMVIRCYRTGGNKLYGELIGALETIAEELVAAYKEERDERAREEAKYRRCQEMYNSCKASKDRQEVFAVWLKRFQEFGFNDVDVDNKDE